MQSEFNLLVAVVQLKNTQALIAAVRAGDQPVSKQLGSIGIAVDTYQPSQCCPNSCEPVYTNRRIIHLEPRYVPGPIIHLQPKVECEPPLFTACKSSADEFHIGPPPIWKTLPWPMTTPIQLHIKPVTTQPDTNHKGMLIDLFA